MTERTKGFVIRLRPYGNDVVGYVVDVSAAKAKRQVIYQVSDVCRVGFGDIASCRRVPELDGRPITTNSWATIESVPND